jgi:hypothetical protein
MDNYINNIKNINCIDDLTQLIANIGLFYDDRNLYGKYQNFMLEKGQGGLWQNPEELATFLWNNKQLFIDSDIQSYLDIGTFNGYTTFVIVEFLKAFVNPNIRVKTIDPFILIHPIMSSYISQYFHQTTIEGVQEEYDLVFIDGLHEYPGPSNDFNHVSKYAKIVFFHDITDRHCPAVRDTFAQLAPLYEHNIVNLSGDLFGIGLLNLQKGCDFRTQVEDSLLG